MKDWVCEESETSSFSLEFKLDSLARLGYEIYKIDLVDGKKFIITAFKEMSLEEAAKKYHADKRNETEKKLDKWFEK